MNNKVTIITGANSGIGKLTARELLKLGYRVVMICRNPEKAERARQEIVQYTGNDQTEILICDLSEMDQIRDTAAIIKRKYNRLDRLVNNAGILPDDERKENSDGIEITFAVNHLAYFLLTNELMPLLEKTPKSRVINVASEANRYGEFDPDDLQLERNYSARKAYGNSKLFNIMFTHQLNEELKDKEITTYCLHPGVVNTKIASKSDSLFATLFNLGRLFMISPEKGAETILYLCKESGIEKYSGRYFIKSKLAKPSNKVATDNALCKELWEISEKILNNLNQNRPK